VGGAEEAEEVEAEDFLDVGTAEAVLDEGARDIGHLAVLLQATLSGLHICPLAQKAQRRLSPCDGLAPDTGASRNAMRSGGRHPQRAAQY